MKRDVGAVILLLTFSIFAFAAEVPPTETFRPSFRLDPSLVHLDAVNKYAKSQVDKAKAAGRPIQPRVAISGGTTLISLETMALCDAAKGCPLLVFRDINKRPVLVTTSFQNVLIEVKGTKTTLVLRDSGPDRECVVSAGPTAHCQPRKPAAKVSLLTH